MIEYLKLAREDIFVDLGCGKGRVLALVCGQSLKKVVGVELQPHLAKKAEDNLKNLKSKKTPADVFQIDVVDFNPDEGTIFFLYDPFQYQTFMRVLGNIKQSLQRRHRKIRLAYFDERYADILNSEEWLISEGEIGHTRILVWTNKTT
jgi:SAM-dependent methyltransferase